MIAKANPHSSLSRFSNPLEDSCKHKVIFLIGSTGVGKTQAGLELAKLIPCEFISADSMQIYKGMDVVTDKLSKSLRKLYPCHLIDIVDPEKDFNVADFCSRAKKAILEILEKKKWPVVLGGTGLYVDSLLFGIFEGAARDKKMRLSLEADVEAQGLDFLYQRLKRIDPLASAKIDPHDKKRIIRALEVFETTTQPISSLQKKRQGLADAYTVYLFGLRRSREDLYRRIDQRVDFMVNAGLLDEVRNLLKNKLSATAYYCIGVREIEGFLKGQYELEEAVRLIKRNSRRFAKRQMTWFNKNKDIEWIDVKEDEDLESVARLICQRVGIYHLN